jgi:hypothetical protein
MVVLLIKLDDAQALLGHHRLHEGMKLSYNSFSLAEISTLTTTAYVSGTQCVADIFAFHFIHFNLIQA